ncbi:MAG: hypothetical protein HY429_03205 [Candidatus Levybacteria bacterium]|nr:hypothetical protein [Candidatus Levybacteria bacterium]
MQRVEGEQRGIEDLAVKGGVIAGAIGLIVMAATGSGEALFALGLLTAGGGLALKKLRKK